jgi:chemotaxis protein MotB
VLAGAIVQRFADRLVMTFPGHMMFGPGRADPIPAAKERIAVVANLLRHLPNQVDVFGHTDPSPVSGAVFESNWELSLARADAVAGMLQTAGYVRPVGAFGLAGTRFSDLAGVTPAARRLSLARRVDIVIRRGGHGQ